MFGVVFVVIDVMIVLFDCDYVVVCVVFVIWFGLFCDVNGLLWLSVCE